MTVDPNINDQALRQLRIEMIRLGTEYSIELPTIGLAKPIPITEQLTDQVFIQQAMAFEGAIISVAETLNLKLAPARQN